MAAAWGGVSRPRIATVDQRVVSGSLQPGRAFALQGGAEWFAGTSSQARPDQARLNCLRASRASRGPDSGSSPFIWSPHQPTWFLFCARPALHFVSSGPKKFHLDLIPQADTRRPPRCACASSASERAWRPCYCMASH